MRAKIYNLAEYRVKKKQREPLKAYHPYEHWKALKKWAWVQRGHFQRRLNKEHD